MRAFHLPAAVMASVLMLGALLGSCGSDVDRRVPVDRTSHREMCHLLNQISGFAIRLAEDRAGAPKDAIATASRLLREIDARRSFSDVITSDLERVRAAVRRAPASFQLHRAVWHRSIELRDDAGSVYMASCFDADDDTFDFL